MVAILHHCELCSTCCNTESAPWSKYYSWCVPTNQLLNQLLAILLKFKLNSKHYECRTAHLCCTHCRVLQTTQTVWSSHNICCVPQYYNMYKSDSNDTPLTSHTCILDSCMQHTNTSTITCTSLCRNATLWPRRGQKCYLNYKAILFIA